MSDNLSLYNKVREVPPEAQKEIAGGRLKGKTDINPMWRIKALTEQFGACGVGWKYTITKQWLENGSGGEIAAFVNIDLYIKVIDEWSESIPGTGGSAFIAAERNGLYTSDECFKMALTDAISVACKALGFGADVYWNKDKTKYDKLPKEVETAKKEPKETPPADEAFDEMLGDLKFLSIEQNNKLYLTANKDSDLIISVFAEFGYSNSKEVPASAFNKIMEKIKLRV